MANRMDSAVDFAKEIVRKSKAMQISNSRMLKVDYGKAVAKEYKELRYYCNKCGLDVKEVLRKAEAEC